jgi:cell division protein WhiA
VERGAATAAVRAELAHVRASKECDRRAELAGLLRAAGTLEVLGGGKIALIAASEDPAVARKIYEGLHATLGARGQLRIVEPGRGHPRPRYAVRAEGMGLQTLVEAGVLDERGAPGEHVPTRLVAKRCDAAAYLRGAFLARGSVGEPSKGAHLEVRTDEASAAEDLARLMTTLGADARTRSHRGAFAAYVKTVEGVGTLLAAMGAHEAYLTWEDWGVWKELHATASRLANADAANAKRLGRAAAAQLAAIDAADEHVGLQNLPAALREIAELRRAHPDASLEELGRLCSPPVGKGAVADRFRRIARAVDPASR